MRMSGDNSISVASFGTDDWKQRHNWEYHRMGWQSGVVPNDSANAAQPSNIYGLQDSKGSECMQIVLLQFINLSGEHLAKSITVRIGQHCHSESSHKLGLVVYKRTQVSCHCLSCIDSYRR